MQAELIKDMIERQLPGATVEVSGDDGVHFQATVVSDAFVGKTPVQQHRMVYAALGGRVESEEIHALALKTYTPEGWRARQAAGRG